MANVYTKRIFKNKKHKSAKQMYFDMKQKIKAAGSKQVPNKRPT